MKKGLLSPMILLGVLSFTAVSSCTSEESEEFEMGNDGIETKSNVSNGSEASTYKVSARKVETKAATARTGYDDIKYYNNVKIKVNSFMALYLQSAPGLYIGKSAQAKIFVTLPNDGKEHVVRKADSPKCGFSPLSSNKEIGYQIKETSDPNKVELITSLYYIQSNISGASGYNKWIPCKPEELVWNYKISTVVDE